MGQPGTIGALAVGRRRHRPPPDITWGEVQQDDPDLGVEWFSVAYSPALDMFVRAGSQGWVYPINVNNLVGRIDWSPDGENWTPTTSSNIGTDRGYTNVLWLPIAGVFVAFRDFSNTPSTNGVVAVSPDGKNWTRHAIPGSGPTGVPIANSGSNVQQGGAVVIPDGSGGEVIVVTGSRVSRNQRSTDGGVTWLAQSMRIPLPGNDDSYQLGTVANADGSLVLSFDIGTNPTRPAKTVDRGVSWTRGSAIPNADDFSILGSAYSPTLGMFAIAGYAFNDDGYNPVLFTSLDGDAWTKRGLPSRDFWFDPQWVTPPTGAPLFLALTSDTAGFSGIPGSESFEFIYSYDGKRWFGANAPIGAGWSDFCVGQGKIVAVGSTYDLSPDSNITGVTVVGTLAP